jgi:uracil-DNA glycosylase family 4
VSDAPRTGAVEPGVTPLTVDADALRPWKQLRADADGCTRCDLASHRSSVVFGTGPEDADLFVLGIAPGRQEDVQGIPFLGAAGNVLTNALNDAGLERDEVYITNLVKCHPPDTRPPRRDEVEACWGYLFEQIAHVRPRVVVTLGELPLAVLTQGRLPLSKVAGYRLDVFDGVTLVPTHSPADAVKGSTLALEAIRRDVATAKAVLDGRLSTGREAVAEALARHGGDA